MCKCFGNICQLKNRPLIGWPSKSTNQRPCFQLTYVSKTLMLPKHLHMIRPYRYIWCTMKLKNSKLPKVMPRKKTLLFYVNWILREMEVCNFTQFSGFWFASQKKKEYLPKFNVMLTSKIKTIRLNRPYSAHVKCQKLNFDLPVQH